MICIILDLHDERLAVFGTAVISTVDNFLRPRLVGGRVGLSELVMFFSLVGGLQVLAC